MNLQLHRVCPYLLDVEYKDVPWPLARFQASKATKEETRKLLKTINEALEEAQLKDGVLEETFDMWWPKLEVRIKAAEESSIESRPAKRGSDDILEEVVSLVRSQSRQIERLQDYVSMLLEASQFGLVAFREGANTPADLEHLKQVGRSPFSKLTSAEAFFGSSTSDARKP